MSNRPPAHSTSGALILPEPICVHKMRSAGIFDHAPIAGQSKRTPAARAAF
jgi:hypothetical protein